MKYFEMLTSFTAAAKERAAFILNCLENNRIEELKNWVKDGQPVNGSTEFPCPDEALISALYEDFPQNEQVADLYQRQQTLIQEAKELAGKVEE